MGKRLDEREQIAEAAESAAAQLRQEVIGGETEDLSSGSHAIIGQQWGRQRLRSLTIMMKIV